MGRPSRGLGAYSASFALHLRHILPDTWTGTSSARRQRSSPGLRDHRAQTEQIRRATVGPSARHGDERIRFGDIGPIDGHGGQRAVVIRVEDAVLTPGLLDRYDVERAPAQRVERIGDAENSLRTRAINRSRQLSPKGRSSAKFATSATPSLPPAPFAKSTISMRSVRVGGTTLPISGGIPSSATRRSLRSSRRSRRGSYRCPHIPSRPT